MLREQAREGFFMGVYRPNPLRRCGEAFDRITKAFLSQPGLPFADLLTAEEIERVFDEHEGCFAPDGVYTTAVTLWAFLNQVLQDGKAAACQAAVAGIVTHCLQTDQAPPTADTGDYCRARQKLREGALRQLSGQVAKGTEEEADPRWLWKGRKTKLIDGFTFTMPDTPANQAAYPQARTQAPGIGLPIARAVAILSLATACVHDAAIGPYTGKQTGEPALLRRMLGSFDAGDVAVCDRYYCSFMMIALLQNRGVDVCARAHHKRHTDFRHGKRLGSNDRRITWSRPARPEWMDEATYAGIPQTLTLRLIRYQVTKPGFRTQTITVITTLTDPDRDSVQDIADLYGFRWNAELDIRSIKAALHLEHLRCKSPAMIRREFWTTLLAYNLIRSTAAAAARVHGKQPRQISFTGTCQYVLSSWMLISCGLIPPSALRHHATQLLRRIAQREVANRPGRFEPRVIKRRPKPHQLMTRPRDQLRAEMRKHPT
jgi:putative transposase